MTQSQALSNLVDRLETLFEDETLSRVVVRRSEMNDRLITYDALPLVRWENIAREAVRQNKLPALVGAAINVSSEADLGDLLLAYQQAVPETPPSTNPALPSTNPVTQPESDAAQSQLRPPEQSERRPPGNPPGQRTVGAWGYAALAGLGLIVSTGLLVYLVRSSKDLVADGTLDRIYYFTVVVLGLSCAAFLFGAMRSYAEFRGKVLSGTLVVTGPAVIAGLVTIGGFVLAPNARPYDITVRVWDEQGNPITSGRLTLYIGRSPQSAAIDADGDADFKEIAGEFKTRKSRITAAIEGYRLKEPSKEYPLNQEVIEVTVVKFEPPRTKISALPEGQTDWPDSTIDAIYALGRKLTYEQSSMLHSEYQKGETELFRLLAEPDTEADVPRMEGILAVLDAIQEKIKPQPRWKELLDLMEKRIPGALERLDERKKARARKGDR